MGRALHTSTPLPYYSVNFFASTKIDALTHRRPESAGISSDSCSAQDSDKRNALCKSFAIASVTTADLKLSDALKQPNKGTNRSTAAAYRVDLVSEM
jgi:hypothetical protein